MYERQYWEDRSVEKPLTYLITTNEDGSTTLIPYEGQIYKEGSKTNANRLNHIEEGIEETSLKQTDLITHKYHVEVTTLINSDADIELPFYYKVGSNCLDVYLLEHLLFKTTDTKEGNYKEIGEVGSISNVIQLDGTSKTWSIPAGYYFDFVVRGEYNAS